MNDDAAYYNDPDFKRALRQYETMRQAGRQVYLDADTLADIAEYYLSNNRVEEADQCVAYALKLHPQGTRLLVFMAKKYLDEGNVQKAASVEESIQDKDDYEVQLLHGELLLHNFEFEQADSYLQACFPQVESQDDAEDYEDVAGLFLDYEQPKRALAWLKKLDARPHGYTYYYLKALAYLHLEQYEDCIATVNASLDANPYYAPGWGVLADAQYLTGDYRKSVDSCDYALAIDAKDTTALLYKAKSLYELQEYEAANEACEAGLRLLPDDVEFLLLAGLCLNQLDRGKEALTRLKKAGSCCPPNATDFLIDIYEQLTIAYNQAGDYEEATNCQEHAVRLGGDEINLHLQRIYAELRTGKQDKALPDCMSLLQDDDIDDSVRLRLVAIISDSGYDNLAYELLKLLLAHYPAIVDLGGYAYFAYVCRKLGKDGEFLEALRKACRETPDKARELFGRDFPSLSPDEYPEEAERKMKRKG